jgi:hypothetical protein
MLIHGCPHKSEHNDEERAARVCDYCDESLGPIEEPDQTEDSYDDGKGDYLRDQMKDPDWASQYDRYRDEDKS